MMDYAQLETLVAVLRRGSFEAAAADLNVTQSAVSQRIRQLEERVGIPLVQRGHPCTGTEMGLRLARHAEEVALLETRLLPTEQEAPARLRIAVNADSLASWILSALAMPRGLLFELVVDDQDHSAEWLKRGEVSAAVTSHPHPPQGCRSQPLGRMRYRATSSPDFFHRHFASGVDNSSIQAAPMLVFNSKDNLQHSWIKKYFDFIHRGNFHQIPSTQGFIEAQILGMGWGLNPESLIIEELRTGRLVELQKGAFLDVPLFWQYSRLLETALQPVSKAVLSVAREKLRLSADKQTIDI